MTGKTALRQLYKHRAHRITEQSYSTLYKGLQMGIDDADIPFVRILHAFQEITNLRSKIGIGEVSGKFVGRYLLSEGMGGR